MSSKWKSNKFQDIEGLEILSKSYAACCQQAIIAAHEISLYDKSLIPRLGFGRFTAAAAYLATDALSDFISTLDPANLKFIDMCGDVVQFSFDR